MKPIISQGWIIFFPPLFYEQWSALVEKVQRLKVKLKEEAFIIHPDVKLLKALDVAIRDKIPPDPFASYFVLSGPLQKYGRVKKMGLPNRYRLFFKAFKERKVLIILWLGFPRKEGDKKDCYQVFSKKVSRGEFPESLEALIIQTEDELTDSNDEEE